MGWFSLLVTELQIEMPQDRACGGVLTGDPDPPPAAGGELVGCGVLPTERD